MTLVLVMILAALIALIVVTAGLVIVQRRRATGGASDARICRLAMRPPVVGAAEGHAGRGRHILRSFPRLPISEPQQHVAVAGQRSAPTGQVAARDRMQ